VLESDSPEWQALYRDILRLPAFHALALHPSLMNLLERLFGEHVLPHSRNICRVMFPETHAHTTPPHQDHLYIGGTRDTWTAWIPLGDCPAELGGLACVPGSHLWGLLPSRPAQGAGGRQVDVPEGAVWAEGEMACGDVLLLHSLCVHQGRNNTSADRLRISVDYRYQPLSQPVRSDSMAPHQGGFGLTWDEIYEGWPEDYPARYYWENWPLQYA
jgi:ectoine hydroxylase-related dioxygenase (phytanoyl-CoA dioxygenase family)